MPEESLVDVSAEAEAVQDQSILETHLPKVDARFLSVLITGQPGVGKTVLACSICEFPEALPVLVLDCDGGLMSVRDKPLAVHTMTQTSALDKVIWAYKKGKAPWGTVILDSLTAYYLMLLEEIGRKRGGQRDEPNQLQDYQRALIIARRQIRQLVACPCHVMVLALEYTQQDDLTSTIRTGPAVPGKFAYEVAKYFDVHGNLVVSMKGKDRSRVLTVQPSRRFQAKDRTGLFEDEIVSPNMSHIVAEYIGKLNPQKEK